jgi:hypothetical protein
LKTSKAGLFHHPLQRGLVGVHADRLGQVAVGVGVAGHPLADARQHLEGVPVVGLLQGLDDLAEFEHQQAAAGLEHAVHLAQRLVLVRHVAQAEGDADEVEALVGEGQLLGVGQQAGGEHAGVEQAVAALAQHGLVDVGVQHQALGPDLAGEGLGEVAGAGGDVEHGLAAAQVGHRHGVGLPDAVQAARHQVVHQVVLAGDGRKHAGDALRLFLLVYRFETEMGLPSEKVGFTA